LKVERFKSLFTKKSQVGVYPLRLLIKSGFTVRRGAEWGSTSSQRLFDYIIKFNIVKKNNDKESRN
jgi:hypothetical protein